MPGHGADRPTGAPGHTRRPPGAESAGRPVKREQLAKWWRRTSLLAAALSIGYGLADDNGWLVAIGFALALAG